MPICLLDSQLSIRLGIVKLLISVIFEKLAGPARAYYIKCPHDHPALTSR